MNFRFMHLADVHLDTPFNSKDADLRSFLRESIIQAFQNCVDIAIHEKVQAVLVAGDLFDNDNLSFKTEKFLINQLEKLNVAEIKFLYATGNHDPSYNLSKYRYNKWPENVYIFGRGNPETYTIKDRNGNIIAVVCGAGHEKEREHRNIVRDFPKAQYGIPYIGLVHTMVYGSKGYKDHEIYAPCTIEDLKSKNYSYWALGHIHNTNIVLEDPLCIYSGNLMGRDFSEEGEKGVYIVEINSEGRARAEFKTVVPANWRTFYIDDLKSCENIVDIEEKIYKSVIEDLEKWSYSGQIIARIILRGPCPLAHELRNDEELEFLKDSIRNRLSINFVELYSDQVVKSADPDRYRNGPHVLGTALSFYDRLKNDEEFLLDFINKEKLAGISDDSNIDEKLDYLRKLLYGLDYELIDRITGGSKK